MWLSLCGDIMKTIIAGSRNIQDLRFVEQAIEESGFNITQVVCGCARGVDDLGRKWAGNGNRIPVKLFMAKWNKLGKSAGYIRNKQMAEYADALIAIWDGESKGTKHMIDLAKERGLKVFVKIYKTQEANLQEIKTDLFQFKQFNPDYKLAHCIAADFGMGAGIAVDFQKKFKLRAALQNYEGAAGVGDCAYVKDVFNLITKKRSTEKPSYISLESSLIHMWDIAIKEGITKIAMPKIGCGLDRLSWPRVKEMLHMIFHNNPEIELIVCYL